MQQQCYWVVLSTLYDGGQQCISLILGTLVVDALYGVIAVLTRQQINNPGQLLQIELCSLMKQLLYATAGFFLVSFVGVFSSPKSAICICRRFT